MLLAAAVGAHAPATAAASPSGPSGVLPSPDSACSHALLAATIGSSAATDMQRLAVAWRASYKR